jgi:phage gp29-like protein
MKKKSKNKSSAPVTSKSKQQLTESVPIVSIYDRFSSYPSKGLTPQKAASLLREADDGDVVRQMELYTEMLEKDPELLGLFQARRLAVTRRKRDIVPFSNDPKDLELAKESEDMIAGIEGFNKVLGDMADCLPKAYSVIQIHREMKDGLCRVAGLERIDQTHFRFGKVSDIYSDPNEIRMLIDPNRVEYYRGIFSDEELRNSPIDGVSLENDPVVRQRFIITRSNAMSGKTSRTALMRPLTYRFLFKNYDVKWLMNFAEILLGYRIGKYDTSQPDQKDLLISAIRGLASDSSAVISKDSEINFVEMLQKSASHDVYKFIIDWVDSGYAKLVLGHTGSSQSTSGKLGNEDMAKEVKQELVEADAETIDEAISNDLIKQQIIINHGPQEGYPYCQTDVSQSLDMKKESDVDINLQKMGFPITKKYISQKYGRPLPNPDDPEDEVLTPIPSNNGFQSSGGDTTVAADGKKKLLNRR